jgi:hypothetical protein
MAPQRAVLMEAKRPRHVAVRVVGGIDSRPLDRLVDNGMLREGRPRHDLVQDMSGNRNEHPIEKTPHQVLHQPVLSPSACTSLIVGRRGQGTSTSAFASLLHEGLYYLGDDYILLKSEPEPTVYGLYGSDSLDEDHLEKHFPALRSATSGQRTLQALVQPITHLPCYLLEVGSDLSSIAPAMADIIERHAHV